MGQYSYECEHLSITLMYIKSQNTAVRSSISYYSFRYFIDVS